MGRCGTAGCIRADGITPDEHAGTEAAKAMYPPAPRTLPSLDEIRSRNRPKVPPTPPLRKVMTAATNEYLKMRPPGLFLPGDFPLDMVTSQQPPWGTSFEWQKASDGRTAGQIQHQTLQKLARQQKRIASLKAELFAATAQDCWSPEIAHELLPLVRPSHLRDEKLASLQSATRAGGSKLQPLLRVRGDTLAGAGGGLKPRSRTFESLPKWSSSGLIEPRLELSTSRALNLGLLVTEHARQVDPDKIASRSFGGGKRRGVAHPMPEGDGQPVFGGGVRLLR